MTVWRIATILGLAVLLSNATKVADMSVTAGDWIQIGIAAGALSILIVAWLVYQVWRPHHHYQMMFAAEKPDEDNNGVIWGWGNAESRKYGTLLKMETGHRRIYAGVRSRYAAEYQRVEFRFIGRHHLRLRWARKWAMLRHVCPIRLEVWHWENENHLIRLTRLEERAKAPRQESTIEVAKTPNQNTAGGGLRIHNAGKVLAYEFMWFVLDVSAVNIWTGHISFEAQMADGRKARVKQGVKIYTPGLSTPSIWSIEVPQQG